MSRVSETADMSPIANGTKLNKKLGYCWDSWRSDEINDSDRSANRMSC